MSDGLDIYGDLHIVQPSPAAKAVPEKPPPQQIVAAAPAATPAPPAVLVAEPAVAPPATPSDAPAAPAAAQWSPGPDGYFQNRVWVPPDSAATPSASSASAAAAPLRLAPNLTSSPAASPRALRSPGPGGDRRTEEAPKEESFEALSKELLADELAPLPAPRASDAARGAVAIEDVAESSSESGEEEAVAGGAGGGAVGELGKKPAVEVRLGEVKASQTGAAYVPIRRKEPPLHIGLSPPPSLASGSTADCLLIAGGLPTWMPETDLRRHAEQFGALRAFRLLDATSGGLLAGLTSSGGSSHSGIALLEYTVPEAAQRAAQLKEGFCALPVWESMKVVAPRLVLVSNELFVKLRAWQPPWLEGGPCGEDLRSILLRQFDRSHEDRGGARRLDDGDARGLRRRASGDVGNTSRGASPEAVDRPDQQEVWKDRLRGLRTNINRRQEAGLAEDPRRKRLRE